MRARPEETGVIHFTGIGGIGMSGIAAVLFALGYKVQGSDIADNANIRRLVASGVPVFIGHDARHVRDVCLVVHSSAVAEDNPEIAAAMARRVPVVRRADMLAELMRLRRGVAVAGSHGKTTTTSLAGHILHEAGLDPTVMIGGIVNAWGSNARLGRGAWLVAEADESDGSFTRLPAEIAVITNMDDEHLDHYGHEDAIHAAFREFAANVPFYGFVVLSADHAETQNLMPALSPRRRVVTYGLGAQADMRGVDVSTRGEGMCFSIVPAPNLGGGVLRDIFLPMAGEHNVCNALAAATVAHLLGVKHDVLRRALASFGGVSRRFEHVGAGGEGGVIISDYAHHPVEIKATLKTARRLYEKRRIVAVFQPHRYSRLKLLLEAFCTCFNDADHVVVTDVYPAGETPLKGAGSEALVAGLKKRGHRSVAAACHGGEEGLIDVLAAHSLPDDVLVCMGAGSIGEWTRRLGGALAAARNTRGIRSIRGIQDIWSRETKAPDKKAKRSVTSVKRGAAVS